MCFYNKGNCERATAPVLEEPVFLLPTEVAFPFFFQQPFKVSKQAIVRREEGWPPYSSILVMYLQFPEVVVQVLKDEQPKVKPQPPPRVYDVST